jgi:tRNA-binding protein
LTYSDFKEAHKPSYKLTIDFAGLGKKSSSAQITSLYDKDQLYNKQIIALINIKPKQIANFMSECLILGVETSHGVVLLQPEQIVNNGKLVS